MHPSPYIHLFLNIEGVVCPRGSAGVVFDAVDPEALPSVWCWAKPLEDIVGAIDLRLVLRSSWTLEKKRPTVGSSSTWAAVRITSARSFHR